MTWARLGRSSWMRAGRSTRRRSRSWSKPSAPLYRARAEASLPLFPGASELIRRARGRGSRGIVSGALRDEIELGIDALGVRDLIVSVVAAEDTRASKPDPHGYLLGIAALSKWLPARDAERALVIEDSLAGIEAAKAAGLPTIAVGHSYPEAELYAHGRIWSSRIWRASTIRSSASCIESCMAKSRLWPIALGLLASFTARGRAALGRGRPALGRLARRDAAAGRWRVERAGARRDPRPHHRSDRERASSSARLWQPALRAHLARGQAARLQLGQPDSVRARP